MAKTDVSERVRQCVLQKYVAPARSRGERTVEVVSGDVHRELGLKSRVPQVCDAMRSKKLLERHGLRARVLAAPPSGQGTTLRIAYDFVDTPASQHPLWALRGVAKEAFFQLGGGEAFLKSERERFTAREPVE